MTVYLYICDSNIYHSLAIDPTLPVDWTIQFDGRRIGDSWQPVSARLYEIEEEGDFPSFEGHLPVMTESVWQQLEPLIGNYVEALPISLTSPIETTLYLINITNVLDCLNKQESVIKYFTGDQIMIVDHHVFDESVISDQPIFRIKDYEIGRAFVSDIFRETVESAGLKGLNWRTLS